MAGGGGQGGEELWLDPAIRNWVLVPIMLVMILVGLLRHNITILMSSTPKVDAKGVREAQALQRARILRVNGNHVHRAAFGARKEYLAEKMAAGDFLRNPKPANGAVPAMDKAGMETMMDGLKKNMMMIVPQSIIMTWVTFFFSGFVLLKLPFPLTVRFKAMLQRGIETSEMDVSWVSSLSWYFLLLFGLRSIFILFLGDENAADSMRDMQAMGGMGATGQPVDMGKLFTVEKENLDLHTHKWELADVEQRLLKTASGSSAAPRPASRSAKKTA